MSTRTSLGRRRNLVSNSLSGRDRGRESIPGPVWPFAGAVLASTPRRSTNQDSPVGCVTWNRLAGLSTVEDDVSCCTACSFVSVTCAAPHADKRLLFALATILIVVAVPAWLLTVAADDAVIVGLAIAAFTCTAGSALGLICIAIWLSLRWPDRDRTVGPDGPDVGSGSR